MYTKTKTSLSKFLEKKFLLLEELCSWLYDNRKEFGRVDDDKFLIAFDYPDYLGMPKTMIRKLNSDLVDRIQDHQEELKTVRSPTTIARWFIDV